MVWVTSNFDKMMVKQLWVWQRFKICGRNMEDGDEKTWNITRLFDCFQPPREGIGIFAFYQLRGCRPGSTINTNRYMIKSTLKIARRCPLVIQGFSNFLGLFQVIMANPEDLFQWNLIECYQFNSWSNQGADDPISLGRWSLVSI